MLKISFHSNLELSFASAPGLAQNSTYMIGSILCFWGFDPAARIQGTSLADKGTKSRGDDGRSRGRWQVKVTFYVQTHKHDFGTFQLQFCQVLLHL